MFNFCYLFKLLYKSQVLRFLKIFLILVLRVFWVKLQVKICQDLTNELSIFIDHIEELRLITLFLKRTDNNREFTKYAIRLFDTKHWLCFVVNSDAHISFKRQVFLHLNINWINVVPNGVVSFFVFTLQFLVVLVTNVDVNTCFKISFLFGTC